jgi:hypothetical protein
MLRISVRSLLLMLVLLAAGRASVAQISITVGFAPPELPVYEQPLCPGDDYIWTPGYWAWDPDAADYYWVPGTWVLAPQPGFLWTPPYWGWGTGGYVFYPGYWGSEVGFYGGIVYGFGYFGHGFDGGRWQGGHFFYNTYVIRNVYETRIENVNVNVTRVSFNGGNGGVNVRATAAEEAYGRERHVEATSVQQEHIRAAMGNTQFRASTNHGRPPVAATARPGEFSGREVVAARSGANYNPPANRGNENRGTPFNKEENKPPSAIHPKELPQAQHMTAPNTGNAKTDQKYQAQQDKLYQKQDQERQKLQQKQDAEHQKAQQHNYNQTQQQQMEQHHQQQTQQLQQRHTQQTQQLQQRQAPPAAHPAPEHH